MAAAENRLGKPPRNAESAYVLFDTVKDISMNFEMHKWVLKSQEVKSLKSALEGNKSVEVFGVYGWPSTCATVIQTLLSVGKITLPESPESDQLLAFFSAEERKVCIAYIQANPQLFVKRPYPQGSRENVYLRLLLDLAPTVICCPPLPVTVSASPLNHPFVPAKYDSKDILSKTREVTSPELKPLRVEFPDYHQSSGKSPLDPPDSPFIFGNDCCWCVYLKTSEKTDLRPFKKQEDSALTAFLAHLKSTLLRAGLITDWSITTQYQQYLDIVRQIYTEPEVAIGEIKLLAHRLTEEWQTAVFHPVLRDFVSALKRKFELNERALNLLLGDWVQSLRVLDDFRRCAAAVESSITGMPGEEFDDSSLYKGALEPIVASHAEALHASAQRWVDDELSTFSFRLSKTMSKYAKKDIIYKLALRTVNIEVEEETSIRFSVTQVEHTSVFDVPLRTSEIFTIDKKVAFAAFKDATSKTQLVKFNPQSNSRYDVVSEELDGSVVLVRGSTTTFFVSYQPKERKACYGEMSNGRVFTGGVSLPLYKDPFFEIKSACLQPDRKMLYLINQQSRVFYMDLMGEDEYRDLMLATAKTHDDVLDVSCDPLIPQKGGNFIDVQSSKDESTLFLLTERAVEIFNINFVPQGVIDLQTQMLMKVISEEYYNYIILFEKEGGFKTYLYYGPNQYQETTQTGKNRERPEGNPVIDVWGYVKLKYGVTRLERRLYLESIHSGDCSALIDYANSIPEVQALFSTLGAWTVASPPLVDEVQAEELVFRICTLQPVHICSVQDGNLVPLQDSRSNISEFRNAIATSENGFLETFVEFMHLGYIEELLNERPFVVSIMGKQSSGKSYLMNQLFGSRFDVASSRCTDGIWMSVSRFAGRLVVALDCEGLFSTERTEQEEMKMCLFIAAVSDVTILNVDIGISKHITDFLQKFTNAASRLQGKQLFKGILAFVLRDVSERKGAIDNLNKNLDKMRKEGRAGFIEKVFSNQIRHAPLHHYGKAEFPDEIEGLRAMLFKNEGHWTSWTEFLDVMKTALAQVYADDVISVDTRLSDAKLKTLRLKIVKRLNDGQDIFAYFADKLVVVAAGQEIGKKRTIEFNLTSIRLDGTSILGQVSNIVIGAFGNEELVLHNDEMVATIETVVEKYFSELITQVIAKYQSGISDLCPTDVRESHVHQLERDLILFQNRERACRRKCGACDLKCLLPRQHENQDDCHSQHKCVLPCLKCPSQRCAKIANHKFDHLCDANHSCEQQCGYCEDKCQKALGHSGEHSCGHAHACDQMCAMEKYCKERCAEDKATPHSTHSCGYSSCSAPCQFSGCLLNCSEADHLHELHGRKLHMCDNSHPCPEVCQAAGICSVEYHTVKKEWRTAYYDFIEMKATRLKCSKMVPRREMKHYGGHQCAVEMHHCETRCPDCEAYCEFGPNHKDLHQTRAHRNKTKCVYINREDLISVTSDVRKHGAFIATAGEKAFPEYCDLSCAAKGRGHMHPVECKGQCLERKYPGKAMHSREQMKGSNVTKLDFLECRTYYAHFGWRAPVETIRRSAEEQDKFAYCPFYCPEKHEDKKYCEKLLFHSMSVQRKDHEFLCSHPSVESFDVCFVLDCTGSMHPYFDMVKAVIREVLIDPKASGVKFALVAYTDHSGDRGMMSDGDNPVLTYPDSKNLADYNCSEIESFITRLRAGGGGSMWGEALIDGLYEASHLLYRSNVARLVYVIADDTAHGREFDPGVKYPDGCPCGRNWKQILSSLKSSKVLLKVVKLGSVMQTLCQLFAQAYGDGFEVIDLNSMKNMFVQRVTNSIVSVMHHYMEFSVGQ